MTRASVRLGGGGEEVHVYKSVHRHSRKLNLPVSNINESMKLKIKGNMQKRMRDWRLEYASEGDRVCLLNIERKSIRKVTKGGKCSKISIYIFVLYT